MTSLYALLFSCFLIWPSLSEGVVVRTRITPENGIVSIGQIVKMVIRDNQQFR